MWSCNHVRTKHKHHAAWLYILKWRLSTKPNSDSKNGFSCDTHPSQIFFTRFFSWSPWKKMMNTDLWTWSPCWKGNEILDSALCLTLTCKQGNVPRSPHVLFMCVIIPFLFETLFSLLLSTTPLLLYSLWWGPLVGPRSLPSLKRHYHDTPSTASAQRWESSPCWSLRPRNCTDTKPAPQKCCSLSN